MTKDSVTTDLLSFLTDATTPFHAVGVMAERLLAAGFAPWSDARREPIVAGGKYFTVRNDSSFIGFTAGRDLSQGLRLVGAHTDSPNLSVRPNPSVNRFGCNLLAVDVYGGALLNPWFDRDLSMAGKVSFETGTGELVSRLIDFKAPVAVIPSLAIHLDHDANKGRTVNPQTDMLPLVSLSSGDGDFDIHAMLTAQIAAEYPDLDIKKILDWELSLYDTQAPGFVGLNNDFIASARLDNLLSCFGGLQAIINSADSGEWNLFVANDHEEVGSASAVGAQGPMLNDVLRAIAPDPIDDRALRQASWMLSVDNAHAIHPNYPTKHDELHAPLLGSGPVIKINRNQRYATSGEGAARVRLLAERAGVSVQSFVVRADMGCGSTIGPITATETGIPTTDIGVPTLGMHSIRELAAADDPAKLVDLLSAFYNRVA